ncbi:hypothetical protein Csa_008532 [Cucumis sativus]|nr:hypothetical protein Csa_008532 [Cucumis sativus]
MRTIVCVEMGLANQPFKRHWTTPVELELTVLQSSPVALVFSPTLLKITAITLSTVISSEKGKSKEAVTSTVPPRPALPSLPLRLLVASILLAPAMREHRRRTVVELRRR